MEQAARRTNIVFSAVKKTFAERAVLASADNGVAQAGEPREDTISTVCLVLKYDNNITIIPADIQSATHFQSKTEGSRCDHVDLFSVKSLQVGNLFVHLNIKSLVPKLAELEALLSVLGMPKLVLISETWLSQKSVAINIDNYCLIPSPLSKNCGGCVAALVHNT